MPGIDLNFIGSTGDEQQAASRGRSRVDGQIEMESIRPENTDPIPLRSSPPRMGTIMIRFVGLLFVVVAILAFVYSR